jgi:hypothetical protein
MYDRLNKEEENAKEKKRERECVMERVSEKTTCIFNN